VKKLSLVLLAVLVIVSCGPKPPTRRPQEDAADCSAACKHLQDLKCSEGNAIVIPGHKADGSPDPGNSTTVSCEAWCKDTEAKGHALNEACVLTITECSELSPKCDW
jgi:hypothetical protein